MDFTKFVALLETSALFFPRVSALDDPFEGAFPRGQPVLERVLGMLGKHRPPPGAVIHLSPGLEDTWRMMRKWTTVSCWHVSEHESAAMWQLYAPTGAAIAVQSTVGRLREALGTPPPPEPGYFGSEEFHIGVVEYIDYATGHIPTGSIAAQFFRKRHSFEHEKELRALFMRYPVGSDQRPGRDVEPTDNGISFPVRLNSLVERVRVAPQSPSWYSDLVGRIVARYSLAADVLKSDLDSEPLY